MFDLDLGILDKREHPFNQAMLYHERTTCLHVSPFPLWRLMKDNAYHASLCFELNICKKRGAFWLGRVWIPDPRSPSRIG